MLSDIVVITIGIILFIAALIVIAALIHPVTGDCPNHAESLEAKD